MGIFDVTIIIVWTCVILGIGIYAGIKTNFDGFWLNNKNTNLGALICTIVATQVGSGTIFGIASSTYKAGIGFGLVAIISTVTGFLLLAWLTPEIKAFGNKTNAITLPEIIKSRYGRSAQFIAGIVIIFAYFALLGSQMLAMGLIFRNWIGISFNIAMLLASVGVILYSAFAGLKGDIVTDVVHFWFMGIMLFVVFLPSVLTKEPVIDILKTIPAESYSAITFGGYTYLIAGILFGAIIPVVSTELWLRIFSSSSASISRKSLIWSALLVIPFYILPMFIGLVSIKTIPDLKVQDYLIVKSMVKYLPSGLLGLAVASLFAVLISTANTMIVVIGSVFYRDILGKPLTGGKKELSQSRLITLGIGIIGAIFPMMIPNIVKLVLSAFFVVSVLFPALVCYKVWPGVTAQGGTFSIGIGALVTIVLLPKMPTQAFLPGLAAAIVTIVFVSLYTKKRGSNMTNE